MSNIPETLRTGLVGEIEPSETENAFMKRILGLVMAMLNRSMETAAKYTAHATRSVVLPADVHMALKYHARRFFSDESMDSLERTELRDMESLLESVQDTDSECDSDSDTENENSSSEAAIQDLQWTRSKCTCDFCTSMHTVDEMWDSWVPEDPEEQFLKSSVEKTIQKTFSAV